MSRAESNEKTSGHNFFLYSAIAMAAVVFAGFARTFFLRPWFPNAQEFAAPEPIFLVHGVVFTAWIAWLILQASLIRVRRVALHRSLGWVGAALAVLVVCLGTYGASVGANRPGGFIGLDIPSEQYLAVPLTFMAYFGTFVALGIANRRRPAYHKRLMLLATVNLLEAAIIRIPIPFIIAHAPLTSFGPALLFIVALGIHDKRMLGRVHPVTLWGGIAIVLSLPLAMLVSGTGAWLGFARWFLGVLA